MIGERWPRMLLAALLAITIPTAAAALPGLAGPEGERWDLTAYDDDGLLTSVPWNIDATLLLEDGVASGSGGCNRFSGSYEIEGEALGIGDTLTMTQAACVGDAAAVEAGYGAALPQVSSWAIADDMLRLSDATGTVILEFAQPVAGLTSSDIAGLVALLEAQRADLDRIEKRLDSVRIGTLPARIKALEAQVDSLKASAAAASKTKNPAFTAAEKVLRTAIPSGIRQTCEPRREQNPSGTVAALQCKPETGKVRDMAYYLMDGPDATAVLEERMVTYGAKPRGGASCARGRPGVVYFTGAIQLSGCYVNEDGRANLRYVVPPWDGCRDLKAGGAQIGYPTLYIAVLGQDDDLKTLAKWAEPRADGRPTALFKRFGRPVAACGSTPEL